jgi:NAD-specific glutamate dehydrogenase
VRIKAILNYANYLYVQKGQVEKALKLFDDYWHWFNRTPEFIIMQSRYCWAEGSREIKYNSIKILKDYIAKKPKIDEETFLEIIGTLMTYSAIMLVSEREEIKEKKRFKEISEKKFVSLNLEQRTRFNELFKYPGLKLYRTVKDRNLMDFKPKCRNFILDGLTHFTELCIRVNKRDIAKEVCSKIINEMPTDYHKPFSHKLKKIDFIENGRGNRNHENSDIAIKLKEAMNK